MRVSTAKPDRKADVKTRLVNPEISPSKFLELCWETAEIDSIDVYRITAGVPSKLPEKIERGFAPDEVEQYLIGRYGAGKFRLSPKWTPDGYYVTSRTWGIGDFTDAPVSTAVPTPGATPGATVDTNAVLRALTEELKGMGVLETYKDFLIQKQDAAAAREMKPIEVLANIVTGLLAAKSHAPAQDPEVERLRTELAGLQRAQLESVQKKLEALEAKAQPAAATSAGGIATQIEEITKAAQLLGLGKTGTAEPASLWTPDGIAAMLTAAAPMIDKTLDRLERLRGPAGAVAALPARTDPVVPTGAKEDAVKLAPEDREQVDNLLHAMDIEDWETTLFILETYVQLPINPRVNVVAYMPTLKKMDPKFAERQGAMLEFLKWVEKQREPEAK